jgi:hypothetical protein
MLRDGFYTYSPLLETADRGGDGTVSIASIPKGVPLDDNTIRRIADKHGNLQCNSAALDEVESVITANPIIIKAAGSTELGVSAPELITSTQVSKPSSPHLIAARSGRRHTARRTWPKR